jgi:hypothetical protein
MNKLTKGILGAAAAGVSAGVGALVSNEIKKRQPLPEIPNYVRTTASQFGSSLPPVPVDITIVEESAVFVSADPRTRFSMTTLATVEDVKRAGVPDDAIEKLKSKGLKNSHMDLTINQPRDPEEVKRYIETVDLEAPPREARSPDKFERPQG